MQRDAYEKLRDQRDWRHVRAFEDVGSGASDQRPQLQAMIAAARRGELDVIVAYSFSRLFRSMRHAITLIEELAACRVRLLTVREGLDTNNESPFARHQLHMIAASAQLERDLIAERTRDGLQAAKRRGTQLGRPRRSIDMHVVRDYLARKWPLERIARKLGVGYGTLYRAVQATRTN